MNRAMAALGLFAVNGAGAAVIGAGVAAELILLACAPDHILRIPGITPCFAAVFVLWFWMTVALALCGAARAVMAVRSSRRRFEAARWSFVAVVGVLAVVYALSWGLYLRAGRFANVESIQFVLANVRMIGLYLLQAEAGELILFGVLLAALFAALPLSIRWLGRPAEGEPGVRALRRKRVWMALAGVVMAGQLAASGQNDGRLRSGFYAHSLRNQLNPVLTLCFSAAEAWQGERIEACLATERLRPLGDRTPRPEAAAGVPRPSIIFLEVESLRHDVVHLRHQGREVMPNLNRLARGGVQFTRAYAQATHSDYSDVSIVSSLYPLRTPHHHYYRRSDPWPRTLIYDVLKGAGYATAIISSQNESWGGMSNFYESPSLDVFFDAERSGLPGRISELDVGARHELEIGALRAGNLDDAITTGVATEWIRRHAAAKQPFFMCTNFQNSHFPYEIAPEAPRPFQPCALDFPCSFLSYPAEKADVVRNAYYNALHEIDRQIGRIVDTLRETGALDSTILVVMGENGECFGENGAITHAGRPWDPAVHVACVVHAPALVRPRVDGYPVELIDLVPSALGLVGLPPHPNFQGIDVLAAGRPVERDRLIFLHAETGIARADGVLLGGRWKFMHDRETGQEWLFDLESDPAESCDLLERQAGMASALRRVLGAWRARQLAYYHYPQYYLKYFPPQAPEWSEYAALASLR